MAEIDASAFTLKFCAAPILLFLWMKFVAGPRGPSPPAADLFVSSSALPTVLESRLCLKYRQNRQKTPKITNSSALKFRYYIKVLRSNCQAYRGKPMARPARKMALPRLIGTLLALTLLSSSPALAAAPSSSYAPFTATGSVIANHDGDTFKLQTPDRGILTIRFSGIDTPETGQAFWKSARRSLAGLVRGQPVTVRCYKKSHERDVCRVFAGTARAGRGSGDGSLRNGVACIPVCPRAN